MTDDPADLLGEMGETYRRKNADYGDSWRRAGEIMHQMAGGEPVTIESVGEWIRIGLYFQRLHKLQRGFNGEFLADEMNFESIRDSHTDEGVYAAMHATTHDPAAFDPDVVGNVDADWGKYEKKKFDESHLGGDD